MRPLAALVLLSCDLTVCAQCLEGRFGLLDRAAASSDGVTFSIRILDAAGKPLATLLERDRKASGWRFFRRDLGRFGGQDVWLQLEVSPGPAKDPRWDWAVWYRPVVKDAEGKVILDLLAQLPEAEVGYIIDGQPTVVGKGAQVNLDGANHGLTVWTGTALPQTHEVVTDAVFVVAGRSVQGEVLFMHPAFNEGIGSAFVRYRLQLPETGARLAAVPEAEYEYPRLVPGYRGELDESEPLAAPATVSPLAQSQPPADLSLTEMAARAMYYLIHNPLPDKNYECRFDIGLLGNPPSMGGGTRDPYITFGDTECRMDWEFIYMREMSGSKEGAEVEDAIRRRIMGYIRDDGLCWLPPYCLTCDLTDHVPVAHVWATDKALMTLTELSVRDGKPAHLEVARKLIGGLKSLAAWDTGRAYYPGGMGGWRNGDWIYTGCSDVYPCILEPLARYIEVTGDQDALAFARAFADGQLAGLQKTLGGNRILDDGSSHANNCHLSMRAALGVAHLGLLTHNTRYLEWARRAYDFMVTQGTDWGWFPESIGSGNSETCVTGDMADLAAVFARAGYSRYWDDLERMVRNYCREAQFFVTPEFAAFYREAHKDDPAQAEAGLRLVSDFQGGFVARVQPNALNAGFGMNMMGCCPPEGMRALHTAWANVVTEGPEGIFVNLCLNRDAAQARVVSFAPAAGRMTVVVKKAGDVFLRPPSWAPRGEVKAYRGEQAIPAAWATDYVRFPQATVGEELTITYPVLRFRQTAPVAGASYTYSWLGNTVLAVDPPGPGLPLFAHAPRPLPQIQAPAR
jgi:hypothetical protein